MRYEPKRNLTFLELPAPVTTIIIKYRTVVLSLARLISTKMRKMIDISHIQERSSVENMVGGAPRFHRARIRRVSILRKYAIIMYDIVPLPTSL